MKTNAAVVLVFFATVCNSYVVNKENFLAYRHRREVTMKPPTVISPVTRKEVSPEEVPVTEGNIENKGSSDSVVTKGFTDPLKDPNAEHANRETINQQGTKTLDPQMYFQEQTGSQGDQSSHGEFHRNMFNFAHFPRATQDPDLHHTPTPDPDLQHEPTPDPDHQHEPTPDPDVQHDPTPDPDLQHEQTPDPDLFNQSGSETPYQYHSPLFMHRQGEQPPMALPLTSSEHVSQDSPMALPLTSEMNHQSQKHAGHQSISEAHNAGSHAESMVVHEMPVAEAMTGHQEMHAEHGADAPTALAQKARPPPNWGPGTGINRQPIPPNTNSPPTTQAPNMFNNMAAMQAMGGGDMFSNMLEMQRKMYQNYPPQEYLQQYQQMYKQMFPNLFGGAASGGGSSSSSEGQSPMMPMYALGMEDGGFMNPMGGDINMQSLYMQQQCQKTPDAPMCKMSPWGMGMMGDIEGPMGEMDMEPGEMDIEGPMAYQLLKRLNMSPQNVHPHHQEITLSRPVLNALQRRFQVNTTADIQGKASDPQFQAFMFQVMKSSRQVAPGEYYANLTQAQVNQILAGLDNAATGVNRIPTSNLDHATMARGNNNRAVLTLDAPTQTNTAFGALPVVAQPGSFQALVQNPGDGGEGAREGTEAPEKKAVTEKAPAATTTATKKANGTEINVKQTAAAKALPPTAASASQSIQQSAIMSPTREALAAAVPTANTAINGAATGVATGQGVAPPANNINPLVQPTQQPVVSNPNKVPTNNIAPVNNVAATGNIGNNNEIRNKDEIPGLSKDARNKAFGKLDKTGILPVKPLSAVPPVQPVTPITSHMITDQRPIGMQEAGIFPGSNGTVPVTKQPSGYSTSTAFAIAAIVLIIMAIIIGPILCMLCKMKEKREERKRKMQALKNRDVSENNIMEAMMLHEFGASGKTSVTNQGAESGNFFRNEPTRYDTIDPEIECLNQSRPLP